MILTKKSRRFFYTVFQEVVILEIYLDVIFLENFLMDYILLLLTGKILQRQGKRLRLVAAGLFGSLYTVGWYIFPLFTEGNADTVRFFLLGQVVNLVVAYVMLLMAFSLVTGVEKIIFLFTFYGLAFAMEGILRWLTGLFPTLEKCRYPIVTTLGMFCFGGMFLKNFTEAIKERMIRKDCSMPVLIRVGEKMISCRGLMDSGNSLFEPISKRPVVIVEGQLLEKNQVKIPAKGFFVIPYHAIGTEKGILKGVLADELEVLGEQGEKRWRKVMLGVYEGKLSAKGEYQVILHPKL